MTIVANLSVLVVEDEYLVAIEAERILCELGAKSVEVAATFEAAQARIAEGSFDVVILDVNLNGQMSFPLDQAAMSRGMPVVFATGYSLRNRPNTDFTGKACVTKPYTAETLSASLALALKGRAASGAVDAGPTKPT
ncbi:MAG: response regulator [Rhodospirillaceae bacterium]|nr:response regulator [Rhodospirillaceae bacterium]